MRIGKENEVTAFLTWNNPKPIRFKCVGIRTACGVDGSWYIGHGNLFK